MQDKASTHRKTKIVSTVGPSSRSPEILADLIRAGVNVFRLNFSHGTHEDHTETLKRIRQASSDTGMPVAVLQDLGGPKIRITAVEGNYVQLHDDALVTLHKDDSKDSNATDVYVRGVNPVELLKPGYRILFADGLIEFKAHEVKEDRVICRVVKGGNLRSRVGIAFPDSVVDLPATTEKDRKDLLWGIEHGIDFVAVSFVKNAEDIQIVRGILEEHKSEIRVISKIEHKSALENIFGILDVSDGIMVARGDLGLELPIERLPMVQKELIAQANYLGIPVIVATQMLHSMVTALRPTRAEVSDVATAVMGGADAVMLSEETAIGNNPVESVVFLDRIAKEAERSFTYEEFRLRLRDADKETIPDAVAYAASAAALKVNATAIIACTETGNSARLVAKYRPQQLLFGATSSEQTLRRMCLYWGVCPVAIDTTKSHKDEFDTAALEVQKLENIPNGEIAVMTGGLTVHTPGSTSVINIKLLNSLEDSS